MNEDTNELNYSVLKKLYICCPVCSKQLLQVESIKGGVLKCHGCHRYIEIDASDGQVLTKLQKKK